MEYFVVENDVGRKTFFVGTGHAEVAQGLEEFGVLDTCCGRQSRDGDGGNLEAQTRLAFRLLIRAMVDHTELGFFSPKEHIEADIGDFYAVVFVVGYLDESHLKHL